MLTELIDHIIGEFSVPERRKVPNVDILLNTRKGVAVSYSTEQIA